MEYIDSSDNKPKSKRNTSLFMLLIALAIHGGLLMLPLAGETETSESVEVEEVIEKEEEKSEKTPKILPATASLPKTPQKPKAIPVPQKPVTASTSQRKTNPQRTSNTSKQRQTTNSSQSRQTRTESSSSQRRASSRNSNSQNRSRTSKKSSSQQSSTSTSQQSNPSQTETPSTVPILSDNTQANPTETSKTSKPSLTLISPLTPQESFQKSFPYYGNALITSGGLLKPEFDNNSYVYHTADDLEDVAKNFKESLKDKGFSILTTIDENEFKVYQVSKNDITQFLHLVFKDKRTAIVLSSESHSVEDLKNSGETKQPLIISFYEKFQEEILENPDFYLQRIKPSDWEIFSTSKLLKQSNENSEEFDPREMLLNRLEAISLPDSEVSQEELLENIQNKLEESQFKVEKNEGSDEGELYTISQEDFTVYMLVLNTPEEPSRTGIIFFQKDSQVELHETEQ